MTDATTEDLLNLSPETVTRDDVDLALVREALREGSGLVRDRAAEIVLALGEDDPEVALSALDAVTSAISADHVNVTEKTVTTVVLLAEEDHVDELEQTVEPLVHCLYDELPRTRAYAAKALGAIAEAHPEWFVPHAETLISIIQMDLDDPLDGAPDLAEAEDEMLERFEMIAEEETKKQFLARATAANLLVEAVRSDPSTGSQYVDELLAAYDDVDPTVMAIVTDVFALIGDADPIAIEDAVEPLIDRLDHPSEEVQARAVKALGFSGDDRAVEPLRALADDDDSDEDLRDLAAETADWIEHNTEN